MKKKKYLGIWFYGLSGSGKSFVAKSLRKKINNSLLVDGDDVRKYVSFDLKYSLNDRKLQIERVYGISKIIILSKKFPIVSTVYFNKKLNNLCSKSKILPIKVIRNDFERIKKTHRTYKNIKDVVGKDIFYENFKTKEIVNNNTKDFIWKYDFLNNLIS